MILHGKFRKVRPDMDGKITTPSRFKGVIKLRGIVWRFLDAPARVITRLKAQISSSHGENGNFAESIQLHRQATASPHTARATAAGKSMKGKLLANFVSYRRAALVNVKSITTGLLGKMQSAAGKNANAIRKMASRLLALLACAVAKILHLGNMIRTAAGSKLDTSGTKAVTAARAVENETSINPANVVGVAVNVSPAAAAAHVATLTTFAEPEPGADDVLPEQQLSFKKNHGGYTSSYGADATLSIALVEGASYIIEWDGKLYGCVARYARWEAKNIGIYSGTCLGDMKNIPQYFFLDTIIHEDRGGGNDEPFFIHTSPGETGAGIETLDTSATHTVRIYTEQ